jgi:uncharacterized membrane protein
MSEGTNATRGRSRETIEGTTRRALLGAGVAGFGFSGLIDVLLLHLVLQWHHLLSGIYSMSTLAGLRTNILADGLFSIGMVVVTGIGLGLLWRAERRTEVPLAIRPIAGSALIGLGAFDLYDAVVDHALLGLHQPIAGAGRPLGLGGQYNPHWAAVSLLFLAAGYYVYRTGTKRRDAASEGT